MAFATARSIDVLPDPPRPVTSSPGTVVCVSKRERKQRNSMTSVNTGFLRMYSEASKAEQFAIVHYRINARQLRRIARFVFSTVPLRLCYSDSFFTAAQEVYSMLHQSRSASLQLMVNKLTEHDPTLPLQPWSHKRQYGHQALSHRETKPVVSLEDRHSKQPLVCSWELFSLGGRVLEVKRE
jgi:hypothetical protein